MVTAIDTNVIVALWDADDSLHVPARGALENAQGGGSLVISPAVYAELMAGPERTAKFVDQFCEDVRIEVEWDMQPEIWKAAGAAFQGYAARRRGQGGAGTRRILTDFVIGAHAWVNGWRLLTLDDRVYRAAFPNLEVAAV